MYMFNVGRRSSRLITCRVSPCLTWAGAVVQRLITCRVSPCLTWAGAVVD